MFLERAKKNLRQYVTIHKSAQLTTASAVTISSDQDNKNNEEDKNNETDKDDKNDQEETTELQASNSEDGVPAKNFVNCDKDFKKFDFIKKTVKIAKLSKFNKWKKNRTAQCGSANYFPISFPLLYGPVDVLDNTEIESTTQFPYNVVFKHVSIYSFC